MHLILFALLCFQDGGSILMSTDGGSLVLTSAADDIVKPIELPEPPVTVKEQPAIHTPPVDTRTHFLVTEMYCPHCPKKKAEFLAAGWPEANVMTVAQCKARFGFAPGFVPYEFGIEQDKVPVAVVTPAPKPVVAPTPPSAQRYIQYGNRVYDMATWRRHCSLRSCGMCNYLDQMAANYRASLRASIPDPQAPSSPDVIDEAIAIMKLTPMDVVAELGSGSGEPAIRMVQASGCRVVGCELDPKKVEESRRNIEIAGLSDKITIIEGDVLDFDPEKHGITCTYAFLYPELLKQITPALSYGRIAVCPGHKPEGIETRLVGQCWVR